MVRSVRRYFRYAPLALPIAALWAASAPALAQGCVAAKGEVAGCQPQAFSPPLAEMPTARIGAKGEVNPQASDAEEDLGIALLEQQLGLFRSFDKVHWVQVVPSQKDANGNWVNGDREGRGDGRALTIAGQCMFAGHSNSGNGGKDARPVDIFKLGADPARDKPVRVSSIPSRPGDDDSILSATLVKTVEGKDTIVMIRDISVDDGLMGVYEVDPASCQVVATADPYKYGGDMHEMGMWIDPANPMRILIASTAYGGTSLPDPERPGKLTPDIRVMAATDEKTGHILKKPVQIAGFILQEVGGPVKDERPDETGMFADGRFPDYSQLKDARGTAIATIKSQNNYAHNVTWSPDGERLYVAGGLAGFYILNSEAVAKNTNAALTAGTVCNRDATNVYKGGVIGSEIEPAKLAQLPRDCVHMVINDDPGVKKLVAAGDVGGYLKLADRSRWDPYPPIQGATGLHSAIIVPGRPAPYKDNVKNRPNWAVVSEERGGCPTSMLYFLNIEQETNPMMISGFGVEQNDVLECLKNPTLEPDGKTPKKNLSWMAHNPTVFKNLVFITWYGQGLRAIDISNIRNPREVGHANTLPLGQARSYPVYRDGLFYWMDNGTGIHVVRYTGPRANELPAAGTGTWQGNDVNHP